MSPGHFGPAVDIDLLCIGCTAAAFRSPVIVADLHITVGPVIRTAPVIAVVRTARFEPGDIDVRRIALIIAG
jgi:hypothetical protein